MAFDGDPKSYDGIPARPRTETPAGDRGSLDPCEMCRRRIKVFRDRVCRRCWFGSRQLALDVDDDEQAAADRRADYKHALAKGRREG